MHKGRKNKLMLDLYCPKVGQVLRRRSVDLEAVKRLDVRKMKIVRTRSEVVKPRLNEEARQPVQILINPVPHQSTFISKFSSPIKKAYSVKERSSESSESSESSDHTQADLYLALDLLGDRACDKVPPGMLTNLSSQSKLNLMVASAIISHDNKATKEYV